MYGFREEVARSWFFQERILKILGIFEVRKADALRTSVLWRLV